MAGETVLLTSGFQLHVDRHERTGENIRLYHGEGFLEIPANKIEGFEEDPPTPVKDLPPVPAAAPAPAAPLHPAAVPQTPKEFAAAAAKKYQLPESFVLSVMKAESNFQPRALSPKGAIGLMQLMQATAKALGVNPYDPGENADGGAKYLRELLLKYEHHPDQVLLALAAYNAGPQAVERYHGVPPYRETREYILRVLREWQRTPVKQN